MSGYAFRLPFRGEPITVVQRGHIVRARAAGCSVDEFTNEKRLRWRQTRRKAAGTVAIEDEGATWVRGWKGDRIAALKTVALLSRVDRDQETWEFKRR